MIREYFLTACCLFWWCIAFMFFAGGAVASLLIDPMTGGICWCISFMTWAMGLAIHDTIRRIRQFRIEDEIIARYKNNG